jgi:hypothetical protein
MNLFFFCFAVVGLTKIIVDSYLFGPVRSLVVQFAPDWINYLFNCHQCMGFWVGMFVGWRLEETFSLDKIFLDGCAGSFLSWAVELLAQWVIMKMEFDVSFPQPAAEED